MNYNFGIDIGSTTIKLVVLDDHGTIIFNSYRRHNADIRNTFSEALKEMREKLGDCSVKTVITGSVGMAYAKKLDLTFVQEVIASAKFIQIKYPEVRTFIDIGGEDSKMIFFNEGKVPDIRMNGSCAGGTGAFIDQVAMLLEINTAELNEMASKAERIYPIASRCGVFSKTDIQNLLSQNVSHNDIAASVFNAVALQVIASLAHGTDIVAPLFFCGGPFAFLPELHKSFLKLLDMKEENCIIPDVAKLVPASGCALLASTMQPKERKLSEIIEEIDSEAFASTVTGATLPRLFESEEELKSWKEANQTHFAGICEMPRSATVRCFLGVDSGSTTTKTVLLDEEGKMIFHDYRNNCGDSFNAFVNALETLKQSALRHDTKIEIVGSAATGYGENLLKTAFGMDRGIVETIAHFTAAKEILPNVSFILDIGGQDMKAIFVENGSIKRIEINEACSSGCGSFIENFANMLNYPVAQFAAISCLAENPCDLGTRCTVFMNSKVKQSLGEGAKVPDIAAGFSYSVIKNCLFKVLKLKDVKELGDNIVVQGGTFKNLSIVRVLEKLTGKKIGFSDIPELMGAYGAALYAKAEFQNREKSVPLSQFIESKEYSSEVEVCPGCENHCTVKVFKFGGDRRFYSGNNCEKHYSNKSENETKGIDMHAEKYIMLLNRKNIAPENAKMRLGIPRGLGIYEDYPFWHALFTECGIMPVLSCASSSRLYESGIKSIMADNVCFPAKLMHGHVMDLINRKVDRIFYPYIIYERKEDKRAADSYNCPIVAGYSDVLKNSIEPEEKYGIPFDAPVITFNDSKLLEKSCASYLKTLGIDRTTIKKAIKSAVSTQNEYLEKLKTRAVEILEESRKNKKMTIVLAGRPYHVDPYIQHKVSQCISEMGINVITENIAATAGEGVYDELLAVPQWTYPNRIFKAAHFVANCDKSVQFVELTSFGCGPDAFILDEVNAILSRKGKNLTILKIDDVNNIGSLRLRVRSLVESLKVASLPEKNIPPKNTAVFTKKDGKKTLLAPYFAEDYSDFLPTIFKIMGYNLVNLPKGTQEAAEIGLKYANNEVCYPATIVVGTIIQALQSGNYDLDNVAVAITQTGGQCRASNYLQLIKTAMITSGFENIPVVAIGFAGDTNNNQPGFHLHFERFLPIAAPSLYFADCLAKLYYASSVREKTHGAAKALRDKIAQLSIPLIANKKMKELKELLKKAVVEFNEITEDVRRPIVGIVGEIYVKYNSFGNKFVVQWLIDHKVEPAMPSIFNFFDNFFVNNHVLKEEHIKKQPLPLFINDLIYHKYVRKVAKEFDEICAPFKYYRPFPNAFNNMEKAKQLINPACNFGEGWLIPAEIANFADHGINNVVSLQPFGCISNHIISKGLEKRVKKVYPKMNILFLDFDLGTSEANIFNRLHFMVENCKAETE
ncbi:2-hydroxyacyl-CoA dehydratase [bacterium]|nr:2-hydroxyacyl-CoA dehydratase [bacterium]